VISPETPEAWVEAARELLPLDQYDYTAGELTFQNARNDFIARFESDEILASQLFEHLICPYSSLRHATIFSASGKVLPSVGTGGTGNLRPQLCNNRHPSPLTPGAMPICIVRQVREWPTNEIHGTGATGSLRENVQSYRWGGSRSPISCATERNPQSQPAGPGTPA
jgi:hypothetical protein